MNINDKILKNVISPTLDRISYIISSKCDPELGCTCESPIERLLQAAFSSFEICSPTWIDWGVFPRSLEPEAETLIKRIQDLGPSRRYGIYSFPQVNIGKFRVDFLCLHFTFDRQKGETVDKLVIECDGHDFHERTKIQAEKDRSRDRELLSIGMPVMRFTGSEIWRDATKCALAVDEYFGKIEHGYLL